MTITDKSRWKYFCWIRVVDLTANVTETPPPPPVPAGRLPTQAPWYQAPQQLAFGYKTEGKPGEPPVVPNNNQSNQQGLPKSVSADATGHWAAVNGFHGRDGALTAFDYGPAFQDEDEAIRWIANDGRQWDQESLNRFLISFTCQPSGGAA
jgi:hypothetical protein